MDTVLWLNKASQNQTAERKKNKVQAERKKPSLIFHMNILHFPFTKIFSVPKLATHHFLAVQYSRVS